MARIKRVCPAGEVFHVLNRAVARLTIFEKPADYDAFMRVLDETWQIVPLPIFAMVAMPNHWHFVVRPTSDDQVSEFFRRLTVMHTMRYHAHYKTGGTGHVYQGRFKSFPHSKRRTLVDGHAVRRTQSGACQLRGACGSLAMGFGLRSSAIGQRTSLAHRPGRSTASASMASVGQQARNRSGTQITTMLHSAGLAVWQ